MKLSGTGATLTAVLVSGACSGPPPALIHDRFLFEPSWILEVDIELAPEDFSDLRHQARDFDDVFCATTPPPNPYSYFPGEVTIDGIRVDAVGVRKKGFFGSVEPGRPSFKLSFDEYRRDQRYFGMRRMTLNNSRSDPAKIKQCLGYELFAAAGVPAPRCNFAHVTVNDEDLGLYVHLESIKTELVARYFEDTSGNLYEGALSDFQSDWIGTFQRKTNLENPDRSDLTRVMEAALVPDSELLTALEEVIALDEFFTFWAMEVIIAHWDGYSSFNHNNYYIYNDPKSGRFHFIPWGIDGILFDNPEAVRSVFADSVLANRLYRHPVGRDLYLGRVETKLEEVWDVGRILSRIDELEQLVEPLADPYDTGDLSRQIDTIRSFVREYPQAIREEIAAGPILWDRPLAGPPCFREVGSVVASFDTNWGTVGSADPFAAGSGSWQVTWTPEEGAPVVEVASLVAAAAGLNREVPPGDPPKPTIQVLGVIPGAANDTVAAVILEFPDAALVSPGALPVGFGGDGAFGVLFRVDPAVEGSEEFFLLDGEVVLEQAATTSGSPVVGSVSADIRETGW